MNARALLAATMLTAALAAASPAGAAPGMAAQHNPRIEFTALLFLFPWLGPVTEMLDPIDVNSIEILFDSIEDPDAFDNPPHG